MLTVHHLNDSRSQRVLWLLEELGLEYEVRHHQRDPRTMLAPAELRRVHPLGKAPVLVDGTVVVAESGAIVEYLVSREGGTLRPAPGTPEHLRYLHFLHYAEGSAMPPLLLRLVFDRIARTPVPFFVRPIVKRIVGTVDQSFITPQLKLHLDYLESELTARDWFAGDQFTAADVQMSFPLEAAAQRAGLDASRPRLFDFLQRIHARPAYRRALERGGPYSFAQQ
jgi:glutathione S-transferase